MKNQNSKPAISRRNPMKWNGILAKLCLAALVLAGATSLAPAGDDDSLVFCVLGDSRGKDDGVNRKALVKFADALAKEHPKFILFPGDLVSRGSERQLANWRETFMKPLLEKDISVYPCRGNHDLGKSRKSNELWRKIFDGEFALPENGPEGEKTLTYEVRTPSAVVFVMDCYIQKNEVNTAWLEGRMKEIKPVENKVHVFSMGHEPLFQVKHKDGLASRPKARDKFLDVLMKNGGVTYFCGHDHFYNHAAASLEGGEFHQFVVGGGGAPLYSWDGKYADKRVREIVHSRKLSYVVVRITGDKAVLTAKAWNPKTDEIEVVDKMAHTIE